jgi:PAS domain S-box-containing protein
MGTPKAPTYGRGRNIQSQGIVEHSLAGTDVTERKAAEVAFAASELRYRRLFETAQDGILILDEPTGNIVDVNPYLIDMLGYSREEYLGKKLWEIGFLKDVAASQAAFEKLRSKGYVRYEDLPLETKDGRKAEVEFVSNAYDAGGQKVIQCNIRDITARRAAERVAAASELRYRRLFETAQDGILILDEPTGNIVDVNPFLIDMLGYSHEEFLGKKLWEIGLWKDEPASRNAFAELQSKGYIRYEDLPLETKGGRKAQVEFVSNTYVAGGHKIIQCNIRDITKRRKMEIALSESRQFIDGILNTVLVRVFWKDKNLVYLGCNAAFAYDAGFADPKDLVGKDDYQLVWRDQAESYRRDDVRVIESGRPKKPIEELQMTADGKTMTVLKSKLPLRGSDGEVVGVLGTYVDITEHKRTEEARRASDENYHRLFDVTRDATMIAEAPSWKFTSGNPAALKMFGASNEEEFASYGPWMLSPERQPDGRASAEKAKAMIETTLREGTNLFEWIYRRIDGVEFPADVLMTPLVQGKSVIIHSTVRDTTERKAAAQALLGSEERFRTLVEQAPEAIVVYDFDLGRFVLANKQAEKLFACNREELLRVGPTRFYSPSQPDGRPSAETFAEHNRRVLAGEAVTFDRQIRSAVGEERLCEVRLVPMPSSESRLMRASYIDITDRAAALQRLERALEGTVAAVASTVEMRDVYTAGHQRRVAKIAEAIAGEIGLSANRIQGLRLASTVHDLGKVNIPAEILSKPGKLTSLEYELIKTHSQVGHDILKPVEFPWPIADIVLQHHERLDGSGYPNGLKGDAILLEAKILAVADVVESMMSHRPYRPALGIDAALAEIRRGSGKVYDAAVVDACLKLLREGDFKFE